MAYPFRNPITPEQVNGTKSVSRSEVFGTNFSVLGIGGYMEVYNLSDLNYTEYQVFFDDNLIDFIVCLYLFCIFKSLAYW